MPMHISYQVLAHYRHYHVLECRRRRHKHLHSQQDLVRNVYPLQVHWHFCCKLKDLNAVTTPIRRPYTELSLQCLEVVVELGPLYQHHHMQLIRITETQAISGCRQSDDKRNRCALDYLSFSLGSSMLLRRPSVDVEVECSLQH